MKKELHNNKKIMRTTIDSEISHRFRRYVKVVKYKKGSEMSDETQARAKKTNRYYVLPRVRNSISRS